MSAAPRPRIDDAEGMTAARGEPPLAVVRPALKVVLINLPWASYRRPSIQIGLLGAIARREGHEVELAHLNLELAAEIGKPLYDRIAEHRSTALGDWLFAEAAFGEAAPPAAGFVAEHGDEVEELLRRARIEVELSSLRYFRMAGAERFLRGQILAHDWSGADVFGLTSTFQQNTACFAMAKLLKQAFPGSTILAGGANFDGEMGAELLKAAEGIDMVVSGEGDETFPRLLASLAAGEALDETPNLIRREGAAVVRAKAAPPFRGLDELPAPDYDEYFARAERLGLLGTGARRDVDIPFETSRGCWWGERRHCTFCGLNGDTMAFRSKSAEKALEELSTLSRRHRSFRFSAVDNILDMKFHKTLFPAMAEKGLTYSLFYEVKSGLSPERLKELRAAGVVRIQPGIESLSTRVLALMNKGVKAIANVNLLRWCARLDIDVHWNLIWGFPGETEEDYLAQARLLPQLVHLQPPIGAGRIWLERFSPLFQERAKTATPLTPERSLRHVYPASVDLQRAAYFFEYDFDGEVSDRVYDAIKEQVATWRSMQAAPERPRLEYRYSEGFLQIDDARWPESSGIYTFEDDIAALYVAMADSPQPIVQLRARCGLEPDRFELAIEQFCEHGLAMRDGDHLLALAVPHHRPGRPS